MQRTFVGPMQPLYINPESAPGYPQFPSLWPQSARITLPHPLQTPSNIKSCTSCVIAVIVHFCLMPQN